MKSRAFPLWSAWVLAFLLGGGAAPAQLISGTFQVTETWEATLTYSDWGDGFNGTRRFSGTQTGRIVVANGSFELLDQSRIRHEPPEGARSRGLSFFGGHYSIPGGKVMPYILAGANLDGILYLSGFMVRVPLVDGQLPTFGNYDSYDTSGTSLAALSASGDMRGGSLNVTVTSTSAWVPVSMAPIVLAGPVDQSVVVGVPVSFSVSAIGSPTLSYQWDKDGLNLPGATAAIYSLAAAQESSAGIYRVTIRNSRGTASSSARLTVDSGMPVITVQPLSQTATPGSTVTLVVMARGTAPLLYQWQKDGVDLLAATSSTYTIADVRSSSAGVYRVIVSNPAGSTNSADALLTVAAPPVIASSPESVMVAPGDSVSLSVIAEGSPPLSYSWRREGMPIPDATNALYIIGNAQSDHAGWYSVTVRNDFGVALSPEAEFKVGVLHEVTTWAGSSAVGSIDGPASVARLDGPHGIAVDAAGNLYVTDDGNQNIRRISPQGVVSTVAGLAGHEGNANGIGTAARFRTPRGIVLDKAGSLYVAGWNNAIRKISPDGWVSTFANVTGEELAIDGGGNLYINDSTSISRISPSGVISRLAGASGIRGATDGIGDIARFQQLSGMAVDSMGNLYAADQVDGTIRRIAPGGQVSTLAGGRGTGLDGQTADGLGSAARFSFPTGLAIDRSDVIYVTQGRTIRRLTAAGVVTTLAGDPRRSGDQDGPAAEARFWGAMGVAVDQGGNLFVCDWQNHNVRKVSAEGMVTTITGSMGSKGSVDGDRQTARFNLAGAVTVNKAGDVVVADMGNRAIRIISPSGTVSTLSVKGTLDAQGNPVQIVFPQTIAADASGNVYVTDNHRILRIDSSGILSVVAGSNNPGATDGLGSAAQFNLPYGLAPDSQGGLLVADRNNHTLRRITAEGRVSTIAGNAGDAGSVDGTANNARFNHPAGVAMDHLGNAYVADSGNHTIRRITRDGVVSTIAGEAGSIFPRGADGPGPTARFNNPQGMAMDSQDNLFIADLNNSLLRRITPEGWVSTLAGMTVQHATIDGFGSVARLGFPSSIAVNGLGQIFFTESGNHIVRKASVPGLSGSPIRFDPPRIVDGKLRLRLRRADGSLPEDLQRLLVQSQARVGAALPWEPVPGPLVIRDGAVTLDASLLPDGSARFYRALEQ